MNDDRFTALMIVGVIIYTVMMIAIMENYLWIGIQINLTILFVLLILLIRAINKRS